ncbi:hypothetical protein DL98DRAFT_522795 [Cadophora sp. DSE1049]|nr:hypothetical protein DL98DRAFT_522795 [Cadophora sp. DSE1049]
MAESIRRTQRAPLSCTSCYSRKVKCSKDVPCRQCISRGVAAQCRRESVRVQGQIYTAETPRTNPSYESLVEENARLSALVSTFSASKGFGRGVPRDVGDAVVQYEKRLFTAIARVQQPRTVSQHSHITWPSKECSDSILDHAALWTNWMHFAVYAPHFRQEHDLFWSRFSITSLLENEDPLWLAVYFSILAATLLFMNEQDLQRCGASLSSRTTLLRNWYDSALHFLDVADFLRRNNIAVIRVAAILGVVAVNVGDSVRQEKLWACAIRTGQQLNLGWDQMNAGETVVEQETRRRLWWELVICDWLSSPTKTPYIADVDFDCALPMDADDLRLLGSASLIEPDSEQRPRPIQYHIAMAKISIVFNNVRSKLYARRWAGFEVAEMVIIADNELAAVINDLPPHLQNDEVTTTFTAERDAQLPWIRWQKAALTMVLLYHRMCVNRTLQQHYTEGSLNYARARSICLSSAKGIIQAAHQVPGDISRLRSWAPAMHVFAAVATLAIEVGQESESRVLYETDIKLGRDFLKLIESENMVAKEALDILLELIFL